MTRGKVISALLLGAAAPALGGAAALIGFQMARVDLSRALVGVALAQERGVPVRTVEGVRRSLAKYDPSVDLERTLYRPSLRMLLLFDRRDFGGCHIRDHVSGADATVSGSVTPVRTWTWKTRKSGPYLEMLVGSHVETPLTIGAWAEGTIVSHLRVNQSTSNPIFGDYSDWPPTNGAVYLKHGLGDYFTFYKHNGTSESAVDTAWPTTSEFAHVVSVDWGPAGMRIFVDGEEMAANAITDGTRPAPIPLRLNLIGVDLYGQNDVGFLAVWEEQLLAEAHRALARSVRRP